RPQHLVLARGGGQQPVQQPIGFRGCGTQTLRKRWRKLGRQRHNLTCREGIGSSPFRRKRLCRHKSALIHSQGRRSEQLPGPNRPETRFCRTFEFYSDPVFAREYLTELRYTLDFDGFPECVDWGKLAWTRPKTT